MLKFYVDFNSREEIDTVVVRPRQVGVYQDVSEDQMEVGTRVLLYDESMECEGILRHGKHSTWVADLLTETIRHLPLDQCRRYPKTDATLWINLYVHQGRVLIPTAGETDAGQFRNIEPVEVADSSDPVQIQKAFKRVVARGSLSLGTPTPSWPRQSVVEARAGAKSWAEFIRDATVWGVAVKSETFELIPNEFSPPFGFVDAHVKKQVFPSTIGLDALAAKVAEAVGQPSGK